MKIFLHFRFVNIFELSVESEIVEEAAWFFSANILVINISGKFVPRERFC